MLKGLMIMGNDNIGIGDRVRAYDYDCRDLEGPDACFTEGIVLGFENEGDIENGRYVIMADRDVWAGKEMDVRVGTRIYPPANGRVITPANIYVNRVEVLQKKT